MILIFNLLACASVKLEQLPTSKYFFCLGDQASTSNDLDFKSAKSPEQHSSVLTGISKDLNKSGTLTVAEPLILKNVDYNVIFLSNF